MSDTYYKQTEKALANLAGASNIHQYGGYYQVMARYYGTAH